MNHHHVPQKKACVAFFSVLFAAGLFSIIFPSNVAAWSSTIVLAPGIPQDIALNSVTIHARANVTTTISVTIDNNIRNKEFFVNITGTSPLIISVLVDREFSDRRLQQGQDIAVQGTQFRYRYSYGAAVRFQSNDSTSTVQLGGSITAFSQVKNQLTWIAKSLTEPAEDPWSLVNSTLSGDVLYATFGSSAYATIAEQYIPVDWTWTIITVAAIVIIVVSGLVISKVDYVRHAAMKVKSEGVRIHRMSFEKAVNHPVRTRILDLILNQPGIHLNELMRQLGLDSGALTWHLQILIDFQLVKMEKVGQYNSYFPRLPIKNTLPFYLDATKLMKNETGLQLLRTINEEGPKYQAELATILSVEKKTIRYHVKKLVDDGLIEIDEKDGKKYHVLTTKGTELLKTIDELSKQTVE
nr:winged helix-turn-helix transcriptional regulator [Candidatus Sigynarchaeota archaeon]